MRRRVKQLSLGLFGILMLNLAVLSAPGLAQQRALTAADYQRAEKFMGYNTNPLVLRAGVRPTWLPDERFWYRVTTENGAEFSLADPARGTRAPVFDHAKMAVALSAAAGTAYKPFDLPFQTFDLSADGRSLSFNVQARRFTCDIAGTSCTAAASGRAPERGAAASPV